MTDAGPAGHGPVVDLARESLSESAADSVVDTEDTAGEQDGARGAATPLVFDSIYEEYFDFVWRTVRRLGVAERAIDDAAQDVFVVVYRRLADFEGRSTVKSWLFGIARRVARDHRRRAGRKDRAQALPDGLADPASPSPLEDTSKAQAVRVLHELLDSLDDAKREVFVMAELEQMTVPEIAECIGVNLNTVYSRLRAARRAFDDAVARYRARERRRP